MTYMEGEQGGYFFAIGEVIRRQWQRQDYALPALADLAAEVLASRPPVSAGAPMAMLMTGLRHDSGDGLHDERPFGDIALTVYRHPRFFIEVLYWVDGTTAIHQHDFAGAFYVWQGSSIECTYRFEQRHPVNSRFRIGDLLLEKARILRQGDVRPIVAGSAFIHSVFHLARPSVTVVVRSYPDPQARPQLQYRWPGIAIDAHARSAHLLKQRRILDALARLDAAACVDAFLDMLPEWSADERYLVARNLGHDRLNREQRHRVLAAVAERPYGRDMVRSIEHEQRLRLVLKARSQSSDERFRMFLALLLNVPKRHEFASCASALFGVEGLQEQLAAHLEALDRSGLLATRLEAGQAQCIARGLVEGRIDDAAQAAVLRADPLLGFLFEPSDRPPTGH